MDRIDSLLAELSSRHQNHDPRFLAAVRPMVVTILDPTTPESSRVSLLELLAETFERDRRVRLDFAQAHAAWKHFVEVLKLTLRLG